MSGPSENFVDRLTKASAANPLAAALIGGGALWLVLGNERLKSAASTLAEFSEPVAGAGGRVAQSVARSVEDAGSALQARVSATASSIGDRASQAASSFRPESNATTNDSANTTEVFDVDLEGAREVTRRLGRSLRESEKLAQAQSSLSDMLERQPLVLGAVGMVIGAVLAGAFGRTQTEDKLVGNVSDAVIFDLKERADAVSQTLQTSAATLKDEISDAGAELVDRVKQTGQDAFDAGRQGLKG
jgi:hypothetical protein